MLHRHHRLPPAVPGAPQLLPLVHDHLVEGVLHQPRHGGGGCQAHIAGMVAAGQVQVAGQHGVQLADAGEPLDAGICHLRVARRTQQVVHGCLQALLGGHHRKRRRPGNCPRTLQLRHQAAGFLQGGIQLGGGERATRKAGAD